MQDLDRSKVISLVVGITGIYAIYFAIGIIQEAVYSLVNSASRLPTYMIKQENIRISIIPNRNCSSQPSARISSPPSTTASSIPQQNAPAFPG
jgi:hypothetical protein